MPIPPDSSLRALACLVVGLAAGAPTPLAAQLPRVRPEAVDMAADRLARLREAMRGFAERGDVAGVVTLVARRGQLVALDTAGYQDVDAKRPMRPTTIFRIASMSKPVTSVAALLLVEQGRLHLGDPVAKYLPAFDSVRVAVTSADAAGGQTRTFVRPKHPITVHDLLAHRAGLAYGFLDTTLVGDAYRRAGVADGVAPTSATLAENVERIAHQPLSFQPGARWQYSLATDVLGRLVEVVAGMPLDRFLGERVFGPLKMGDTGFYVPDEKLDRLAVPYTHTEGRLRALGDSARFSGGHLVLGGRGWRGSRTYFSGGAGLFSTAGDYARFLQMLLNGGELDGVRLLSPKTVELMTASATGDLGADAVGPGRGYGLGVAVVTDVGASAALGSVGAFSWGGIYGSDFFVDPSEQLLAVLMIQVFPGRAPVHETFGTLVYQAITRAGPARGAEVPPRAARRP